jgi:nucleotide-binding universal stress UspA family protein
METAILPNRTKPETECGLKRIVVGYDASPAAERALHDAVTIGKRFSAEILLAQANAPDEDPASSCDVLRDERMREFHDLEFIRAQLAKAGLSSRSIVRKGIVGDTLFNICCEENADLLLLGAYGFSLRDRQTLGSTAEFLLRAVPCPTLTYGPEVSSAFDAASHKGPVLVPVSLPCGPGYLERAIKIAKLFGVGLELLHVAEHVRPTVVQDLEGECQQLTDRLRCAGVRAQWSLYCGTPDNIIRARAGEIDTPFILMPLKWGHRLSSMTSDNVAAHVIRSSKIPVMTYRVS